MLTPNDLERATPGFRRGYRDACDDRHDNPYPPGSWAADDWQEGYKAGLNDRAWAERNNAKRGEGK